MIKYARAFNPNLFIDICTLLWQSKLEMVSFPTPESALDSCHYGLVIFFKLSKHVIK